MTDIDQQRTTNGSNELERSSKTTTSSLRNVLIISFSFFLLLTSSNTSGAIQKVVVDSVKKQRNIDWDSYLSTCFFYAVYSISNLLVPSILTLISTNACVFLASLGHVIYNLAFFYPFKYELAMASIMVGVTAGVLWPVQNKILSENSNERTIDRNAGLFGSILQSSVIFGNIFVYILFNGVTEITEQKRIQMYSIFFLVSISGAICLLFLKKPKKNAIQISDPKDESESSKPLIKISPIEASKNCFNLFKTKKMFCLCIASFYTGVEQSFFSTIYANTVGFTMAFGTDSKKYIGLYGVFTGLGAVFGGIIVMTGLLKKIRYVEKNRNLVYTLGFLFQLVAFSLVILNHPNRASIEDTPGSGYIEPRVYISLIIGFFLCFGDALYNQMIIAFITTIYVDESDNTSAFTLFKFFNSIGASIAFFYSSFDLTLITHLIILFGSGILGTFSFFLAEKIKKPL